MCEGALIHLGGPRACCELGKVNLVHRHEPGGLGTYVRRLWSTGMNLGGIGTCCKFGKLDLQPSRPLHGVLLMCES